MLAFESSSTISAAPEAVWAVLIDGGAWPSWDSGVANVDGTNLDGTVALGKTLKIQSQVAPGRTFPVKVTTVSEPTSLVFTGGMPLGLFKGVRTYTLTPKGTSTVFTMREEYTGPLSGSIGKSIPDLNPSFVQFANGLKARVEAGK
jgi:uncharacterized protein YndB with AHSA1/START domain